MWLGCPLFNQGFWSGQDWINNIPKRLNWIQLNLPQWSHAIQAKSNIFIVVIYDIFILLYKNVYDTN